MSFVTWSFIISINVFLYLYWVRRYIKLKIFHWLEKYFMYLNKVNDEHIHLSHREVEDFPNIEHNKAKM